MSGKLLQLSELVSDFNNDESRIVSLFKYARESVICSRTYICSRLENEEILSPLMMNIMNLYVGLILTALGMNRAVTGSKTIRDQIQLVSTESFKTNVPMTTLKAALDDFFGSSPRMAKTISTYKESENTQVDEKSSTNVSSRSAENTNIDDRYDTYSGKVVDTQGKEVALPCGRMIQIDLDTGMLVTNNSSEKNFSETEESSNTQNKFTRTNTRSRDVNTYDKKGNIRIDANGQYITETEYTTTHETTAGPNTANSAQNIRTSERNKNSTEYVDAYSKRQSQKVTLTLLLQLTPVFITPDVAESFVRLNFEPGIWQRIRMLSAGEISFFKDFILGMDKERRRMKAMLQDKSGALKDMIDRQTNSMNKHFQKTTTHALGGSDKHANIANTILIFDENTFKRALDGSGFKFNTPEQRQRFFDASYAMMLCVVDPMYGRVTMYYNGLEAYSTWKYDQIKRNAKNESMDLSAIMKNYAANMAPKF